VQYWDTAPLRAMQQAALRARIAEDCLVDPERLALRLGRLVARLERAREGGLAAYLADPDVRLVCERALERLDHFRRFAATALSF